MYFRFAITIWFLGLTWHTGGCHGPAVQKPSPSDVIAFVGVNVVPMDSERILDAQTVLIRGDRITAMGPVASVAVPAAATVIDGKGKYLMPGLVDMHVHLVAPEVLTLFVANGVTTVRNMWGNPEHLELREKIAAGTLVGPRIYTAGAIVDGVPVYWPGSEGIDDPAQAEAIVARQKQAGYDLIKLYMNLNEATYQALIAAAKKHEMKTAGHVPTSVGMRAVLAHPMDSLEHLWGYFLDPAAVPADREGTAIIHAEAQSWMAVSEQEMRDLARVLAQTGIWSCVTLISRKGTASLDDPAAALATVESRYVSPFIKNLWLHGTPYTHVSKEHFAILRASYGKAEMMTRALRDTGAHILLGTDTPNPFVVPGFSVHEELENLVTAGLTPYEAIRAGTRAAAEFLGESDEFGTVAAGMRADLVLVDGNPLADVGNVARITGVMLRGEWFPAERLQTLLDGLVASFSAPGKAGGPDQD